jgi:hypothetical protein
MSYDYGPWSDPASATTLGGEVGVGQVLVKTQGSLALATIKVKEQGQMVTPVVKQKIDGVLETIWSISGGGGPDPDPPEPTYADVVASLGADTYWPMGDASGDFQPEIGSTVLTAGAGLTRNPSGGPEDDPFVHINGAGTLYPTAGRPTATSTWTVAFFLRVASGSNTGYRSIITESSARGLFLHARKVRPYQMLWGTTVGPDLGDDTWHLVAVGSDGASSEAKLWVDGVLVHTGSGHGYLGLGANTQVGSNLAGGEILAADMARLALFPTMLTDAQVTQLWEAST